MIVVMIGSSTSSGISGSDGCRNSICASSFNPQAVAVLVVVGVRGEKSSLPKHFPQLNLLSKPFCVSNLQKKYNIACSNCLRIKVTLLPGKNGVRITKNERIHPNEVQHFSV